MVRSTKKQKGGNNKKERKEIIDYALEGNFLRLVNRLYKVYHYELVFSRKIPRIRRTEEGKKIIKYILKKNRYPINTNQIIKILWALHKYYEYPFNKETAKVAYEIWDKLGEEIEERLSLKYNRVLSVYKKGLKLHTKAEAIREQKARGFVHINDFDGYISKANHVFSTADRDLVLPINFSSSKYINRDNSNAYLGQTLYGVRGWTRVNIYGQKNY